MLPTNIVSSGSKDYNAILSLVSLGVENFKYAAGQRSQNAL
jgi:hypothetical protein